MAHHRVRRMVRGEQVDGMGEIGTIEAAFDDPDEGVSRGRVVRGRIGELQETADESPRLGIFLPRDPVSLFGGLRLLSCLDEELHRAFVFLKHRTVATPGRLCFPRLWRILERPRLWNPEARSQRLPVADEEVPRPGRQGEIAE